MQTLFKKLENNVLLESTKIEKATFRYKAALSEVIVKTNRMGSTNGSITKNSFVSNCIFSKILFQFFKIKLV